MALFLPFLIGAGLALQAYGTIKQVQGQQAETAARIRAENARQQQMNLEALRRRRDIVRNSVIARSNALFAASSQGAQGGSGLQGGYGQIFTEGARQTLSVNQNQVLGGNIFAANRDAYAASGVTSFGQGLTSLGGALVSQAGTIDRLGTYTFGKPRGI